VIDSLRKNYSDAQIDFLVNKKVSPLLIGYPNINKVQSIEKDSARMVKLVCKDENYDLAVIVRPTLPVAVGIFNANILHRLGTAYRWYSFLFNIRHKQHRKGSFKHESQYNLDLLREVGIDETVSAVKIHVSDEEIIWAKKYLIDIKINITKGFIVIHIPSLGSALKWNDRNFPELVKLLLQRDEQIILTGTKDEESYVRELTKDLWNTNLHYIFDLGLNQFKALLSQAKLFIGNSSGPIHIGAAVGTYCIGFYPTIKVQSAIRWAPLTERKKIYEISDDSMKPEPKDVFNFINQNLLK